MKKQAQDQVPTEDQAEQTIKEQSHFIKSITEAIPDLVGIFEIPSRKPLYWNHPPFILNGYTTEEVEAMSSEERANRLVHPDYRQQLNDFYARIENLKAGETTEVEYRFQKKEAGEFWVHVKGTPFEIKDGKVTQAICIARDISEEKNARQEERRKFLLSFSDTLHAIADPLETQRTAMRMLGEHLGISRAFYYTVVQENGNWIYIIKDDWHADPDQPAYREPFPVPALGAKIFARIPLGETFICSDSHRLDITPEELQSYLHQQIISWITYPIIRQGAYEGGVCIHSPIAREWTENEIALTAEVAERTWEALERAEAENTLRKNEMRLKELNENLEQLVEKRTQEIMKLKLKQEKDKLNAVIFAQEQERARIGEALHDGVAQLLYAAQNRLEMIRPADEEDDKTLKSAKDVLSDAIHDTRKISFELMPPALKDYGLEVSLNTLLQRVVPDKLRVQLEISFMGRLAEEIEITLYRIFQEILNNILKHAQASEAIFSLHIRPRYVHLKAHDNGVGFTVPRKSSKKISTLQKGIGLQSMRNRVKLLDGKIKISSRPGHGTTIELQLPLK